MKVFFLKRSAIRSGFDPDFYATHYPDLRRFKSTRKLYTHYLRHGKDEGRYISLVNARETLAGDGRILPEDFDPQVYKNLNNDLCDKYTESWQFELHYLMSGADERRPYALRDHGGEGLGGW